MSINYTDIQEFANGCFESYHKYSIIQDIATVEDYDEHQHQELEFTGAGKRVNLPKRIFSDPATMTMAIESDIGRAAYQAERNLLLENIRERAVNGQIQEYEIEDFEADIIIDLLQNTNFSHVFLPSQPDNDYVSEIYSQLDSHITRDKFYIDESIDNTQLHLLPEDSQLPNNRAYLLNDDLINIVQKRKRDADEPPGMNLIDDYADIGRDEYLMLYFGESSDLHNEFDFFYRILFSDPEIEPDGAASIIAPI